MFIAMAMNGRWQALRASPRQRTRLMPYQRFIVAKARSTLEHTLPAQALWTCCQGSSG